MRVRSTLTALLVLTALAPACGDSGGSTSTTAAPPAVTPGPPLSEIDANGLIDRLRDAGATVERAGSFEAQGLSGTPLVLTVNGADVQVYEYDEAGAARTESGYLSADGSTIEVPGGGVFLPEWLATPHFFLNGRVIVQYIGDDTAAVELLESVLGPQFAGGQAEALPQLVVGTVEPAEGAPMTFEEAAGQAAVVVLAEVTDVAQGPDWVASIDPRLCRPTQLAGVRLLAVYQGPAAPGDDVVIYHDGGLTDDGSGCGDDPAAAAVLLVMEHDPLYDVGQRYLLAYSPLVDALPPDPAIVAANEEVGAVIAQLDPGQVLFSGRLLVEQGAAADLAQADVVAVAYDGRGRAIPGTSTGRSLAEWEAILAG